MNVLTVHMQPENWLLQLFNSKAAREGGVIRRKAVDVERLVGMDRFRRELQQRGFHAVENAGQIIVFCNQQPVQVIC